MHTKISTILTITIIFLACVIVGDADSQTNSEISVTVGNATPEIRYKFELPDDDPTEPGTQVVPFSSLNIDSWECECGCRKTVYEYAVVYDANGADDIQNVHMKTFNPCGDIKDESNADEVDQANIVSVLSEARNASLITPDEKDNILNMINNSIASLYVENTDMCCCCDLKGDYLVDVTATDSCGESDAMENTFEYMEWVMLIMDFSKVDYGNVDPCQNKWVYGDKCPCTNDKPTIMVMSPVETIDIIISATQMDRIGGGGIIPVDRLGAEINGVDKALSEIGVKFEGLPRCTITPLNFSLHPPIGTPSGDYTGMISIMGVPS